MPTILRVGGLRFYFHSHEPNEPPHVPVDRGGASARFRLHDGSVAYNAGFPARDLGALRRLILDRREELMDGRMITVPLAWYPRLASATQAQLDRWEIAGGGWGIHWPDLDEDLSTVGLWRGAPAPRAGGH